MSDYAVVKIGGSQYKVREGDKLTVDGLPAQEGEKLTFDQVFLLVVGDKLIVGEPKVEKAEVVAKVIKYAKGEKIKVARFKAKSRYRKTKGFRPLLTQIEIEKITFSSD